MINKLPREFKIDSYINLSNGDVVSTDDVDNMLYDLTEEMFENYYSNLRAIEIDDFYNRKLFDYSSKVAQDLTKYLLSKPPMKQRDALEYLYGIKDPNKEILMNVVKIFPKEYTKVLKGVLNEYKKYDPEVTYDIICDRAMDVETLETLTEFLPPVKKREQEIINYIYCTIKDIATYVKKSEEFNKYKEDKYKEEFSTIEKELVDKYDAYKKKNYDSFQEKCAQNIIPLFDYIIENNLIKYLDDGKFVVFVDSVEDKGDKLDFSAGISHIIIKKDSIKGFSSNGKAVTVYYEEI